MQQERVIVKSCDAPHLRQLPFHIANAPLQTFWVDVKKKKKKRWEIKATVTLIK